MLSIVIWFHLLRLPDWKMPSTSGRNERHAWISAAEREKAIFRTILCAIQRNELFQPLILCRSLC